MKHRKLQFIFGMTALLCIMVAAGSEAVHAQESLTLEQAMQKALVHNPALRSAEQSVEQAGHSLSAARARMYPSVSLAGSYQRTFDRPEFVIPLPAAFFGPNAEIRTETGAEHTFAGGMVLEQPLYAGGAISTGIGMAADGLKIARHALSAVRQQTIEGVYSAFYGVLLAQNLTEVAATAVENARVNLDQVERRYKEGAASRFERLRAEVQFAAVKPNLTEARNRLATAVEHLKDLLGMDKGKAIQVIGAFEPRSHTLLHTDVVSLIAKAYLERPEYQMQQLQKDIGLKKIRLTRAEFLPTVALSSALQWQALRDDFSVGSGDFNRTSYAGVAIRLPLFSGFGSKARYGEAQAELRKTQIQEANLKNVIATEIRALHNELMQAHEIIQSQREVTEQAKEGLRLANLLYEEGAATLLEVIDAQLAVTQAGTSYSRAIYNFNTASIKLERAVGTLNIESMR
ncbi:MAG: TolC family protein [Deltaproteobacteria bacterium]|nr:TolC family protein [Deltaproteobacteria bacterium]